MNRTRLIVALLGVLFVGSVGTGVVLGQEDSPSRLTSASADVASTTTTVARTTTTATPTTTSTTAVEPTTSTTAPRPATTAPPTTRPAPVTTSPPVTDPPTTEATAPPTTSQTYNPLQCAEINRQYELAGLYDDPGRIAELRLANCPPFYQG